MVNLVKGRSRTENEIPLHLLPHAIARKVREWGDIIYRISIRRTHWHHYNVIVRTKTLARELAPRMTAEGTGSGTRCEAGRDPACSRCKECAV